MITIDDLNRLLGRIRSKLALMVGRAVLAAINNSGKTQKIQVVGLYDETISGVERFQEYGLETYPYKDAEALMVFVNGNRDQGIAACVHDRRYRPKDLAEGEVVLYTKDDEGGEHRIHLKAGKKIEIIGADVSVTVTGNALIGKDSGHKAVCIEDLITQLNNVISSLNSHTHQAGLLIAPPGGGAVTGTSGAPVASINSLVKADLVTKEAKLT